MDEQISVMLKWKGQWVKEKQIQDNIATCYRRGSEQLDEKLLCNPPNRNNPLVNKVGVQGY